MHRYRVVVIGGNGFFGSRLVARLARQSGLHVVVCGRSARQPGSVPLDLRAPDFAQQLQRLAPDAVIHTAGPFQGQDYRVAAACIACGAHYIDLADGREFVAGIGTLAPAATEARVAVISGASSVPALSSAAVDRLARHFTELSGIDIGISPGNRTERGLSTVRAILGYCGKPLPASGSVAAFGWSGSRRHTYPAPVGTRLLSPCDVPDLTLLPARYAGVPAVRFGAGLELPLLHRGMNAMAVMTRLGLVADWSVHAAVLGRIADWFRAMGSDAGAMHVSVTGRTADGSEQTCTWHLVATGGDGPYVPTLAAAALVRKLSGGDTSLVGARPCVGLLCLDDFAREAEGLHITMAEAVP